MSSRMVPLADELIDAFRDAVGVYAELDVTPRWRWRRRRRLDLELDRLAERADELRAERGVAAVAAGLREVLEAVRAGSHSGPTDGRAR